MFNFFLMKVRCVTSIRLQLVHLNFTGYTCFRSQPCYTAVLHSNLHSHMGKNMSPHLTIHLRLWYPARAKHPVNVVICHSSIRTLLHVLSFFSAFQKGGVVSLHSLNTACSVNRINTSLLWVPQQKQNAQ